MALARLCAVVIGALALPGCGPSDDGDLGHATQAVALADQEDEVCGMLVREQSAPRGQVVHHDGSHFFFCSLGDMLVYLSAPSPHGRADAIFVEVMEPWEDPAQSHTGDHRWVLAQDAVYVVGIERQGIMGVPVLSYSERSEAQLAMRGHNGARMLDMAELRDWWSVQAAAR